VATKHEAEVICVAENLAAYLHKAHGDAILQYLNPSVQEDALDTVWDPNTNCPISWEEHQAREAGADDTVPEWVQDTSQADGTTTGLGPEVNCPLRGGFVVNFDNLSHDTFGGNTLRTRLWRVLRGTKEGWLHPNRWWKHY
jgi:hypothetical protein